MVYTIYHNHTSILYTIRIRLANCECCHHHLHWFGSYTTQLYNTPVGVGSQPYGPSDQRLPEPERCKKFGSLSETREITRSYCRHGVGCGAAVFSVVPHSLISYIYQRFQVFQLQYPFGRISDILCFVLCTSYQMRKL